MYKPFTLVFLILAITLTIRAQEPSGYYQQAEGKVNSDLKTALSGIVETHIERTYTNLWTDFQTTDKRADGKVWDMYSNCNFTFGVNQDSGSGGSAECQYYNREHSFPKSWFSSATPMYTDLYHIYPTDKYVNNQRGNDVFGETNSPTQTFSNGSQIGISSMQGYSGIVFEPANEFKGDFARTYFYMVTAYDDKVSTWISDQLSGNQYPALTAWSVAVLLKWNSQDPVSQKEIDRNNAVSSIQHNRNPFIDHPELAEYIWGSHKGEPWYIQTSVDELKFSFNLSPNPVQNQMQINCEAPDFTYKIYDLSGQQRMNGIQSDKYISMANLNNGMYIIELSSGNKKAFQKFIVNK